MPNLELTTRITCEFCSIVILRLLFGKPKIHVSNVLEFSKDPLLRRNLSKQLKVLINIANNLKDLKNV